MLRRLLVAVAAVTLIGAVAGCNATRRELTVVFDPGATPAVRAAVLQACAGAAPHTSPEPMTTPTRHFNSAGPRFRIDAASDRDIAHLESCLQRQPGVRGFQDSADNG